MVSARRACRDGHLKTYPELIYPATIALYNIGTYAYTNVRLAPGQICSDGRVENRKSDQKPNHDADQKCREIGHDRPPELTPGRSKHRLGVAAECTDRRAEINLQT